MNSKNFLFLAIGLIALLIVSAKSAYAYDGDCGKNQTSTCPRINGGSANTPKGCNCTGQEDCKCKENGKECQCNNCKDGNCECKDGKDCKCKADGKNCKCENCKPNGTTTATTTKEKVFKDNVSQTGVMARIKGWLKGFAFWKKK